MVTSEEHLMNLVANAFGREMEVYVYQVNVSASVLPCLRVVDELRNDPLNREVVRRRHSGRATVQNKFPIVFHSRRVQQDGVTF